MKFNIRPLTALAFVLSSLGLVEVGRLTLSATGAFAATEAAAPKEAVIAPSGEASPSEVNTAPPTCLPVDLAKEAGISAAEFRLLQALQERRQQLDARERDIITREGILKTADDVVRARIVSLQAVEANIQKLLGQVDEVEAARLGALVRVYEKMKPKDAAAVMEGLSDDVAIAIASRMKDGPLALILGKMNPARARQITTLLAQIDESKAFTPAPEPTASAAAPKTPPKNQSANNQTKQGQPPAPNTAGPNSPTQPNVPAPKAPNTPSPTNAAPKAATGQAPADPSPKAANGAAAKQ